MYLCNPKTLGSLAQLVQSVCLTSRGSGVRLPQLPQKEVIRQRVASFFYPFFHLFMETRKETLLRKLRSGEEMTRGDQLTLTMLLALPAILAQLSMCLMSYIDTAMVGRLGSNEAASIGLVSTTTWIFGSFCYANSSGYSVQIAHRCGAGDFPGARAVFRKGMMNSFGLSLILCTIGLILSRPLPGWLGGSPEILGEASGYFFVYAAFLPVFQIAVFSEASLIASGNMKVPSIVSMVMCLLDVVFNYLFIFVAGMGVKGAALGTGVAEFTCGAFLLAYSGIHSEALRQIPSRNDDGEVPAAKPAHIRKHENRIITKQAFRISGPLWLQNLVTRGAYIAATVIIAPLGTVAIAANSFAIIAEGFCYLPGYGMQDAATTLIGQSLGAGRKNLARSFARITISSGAAMMTVLAIFMWIFAPQIMDLLSNDQEVIGLGASCLRIEAWAELFFAISIVGYGCCIGAGDTLVPSAINLLSMWVIRIGLALILIPRFGLRGYWMAMASELTVKGIIFAIRIRGEKWMKTKLTQDESDITQGI